MDFLVNVKAGHCERFASALTLMLRSQGIPSRLVVGFRGAEERADDGSYVVRQNQAHAWVEMRVPAHTPPPDPAKGLAVQRFEWVALDPTPAADIPRAAQYTLWDWWQDGQRTGQELWGGLVVNYNAEQQADLWANLQSPRLLATAAGVGLGLPAVAAVGALAWVGLRRRRRALRAAAAAPAAAGYARLAALLARHGGPRPADGQTPREFAAEARHFLLTFAAAAPFADLPDELVDRLYRVRFGGRPLPAAEAAAAEARLDQLAAALGAAPV
jgi:protein-glutamine gamma-glutamyltransferase